MNPQSPLPFDPFPTPVPGTYQVRTWYAGQGRRGIGGFAWVAAGLTLFLIMLGALVTSFEVGMAVPDWPTTFGENMFTYNMFGADLGVILEHTHRLAGALVGLLTLTLAIWLWVTEKRNWVRALGMIALLAVIAQGIMGGLRVVEISPYWAIVHGIFAHAFFGLMVTLALVNSPRWLQRVANAQGQLHAISKLALATSIVIFCQMALGSTYRHLNMSIAPHLIFAIVVVVHIYRLCLKAMNEDQLRPHLQTFAGILGVLLVVQVLLGFGAWGLTASAKAGGAARNIPLLEISLTVAHVATAAIIFAVSLTITLMSKFACATPNTKQQELSTCN